MKCDVGTQGVQRVDATNREAMLQKVYPPDRECEHIHMPFKDTHVNESGTRGVLLPSRVEQIDIGCANTRPCPSTISLLMVHPRVAH